MNVLIINTCYLNLHSNEFVKPIINIVEKQINDYKVIHYKDLNEIVLKNSSKIIICGTALKDFEYLNYIDKFKWLKSYENPVLGICAGAQIISLVFDSKLQNGQKIGLQKLQIMKDDILFKNVDLNEIYSLHNSYTKVPKDFELIAKTKYPQVFKKNNIYAVLFHPEIRNKKLIENFIRIK